MFSAFLSNKIYVACAVLVACMGVALFFTSKYLVSTLETNAVLEENIAARDKQIEDLNTKLINERDALKSSKASEDNIRRNNDKVIDDVSKIPKNKDVPALDPTAVAKFMCDNGLATATACDAALAAEPIE